MTLDYIALAILIAVVLILFYGIIVIHDIPYEIAKKEIIRTRMLFTTPAGSACLRFTCCGRCCGSGRRCGARTAAGECRRRSRKAAICIGT